jgi:hypothetical protein
VLALAADFSALVAALVVVVVENLDLEAAIRELVHDSTTTTVVVVVVAARNSNAAVLDIRDHCHCLSRTVMVF